MGLFFAGGSSNWVISDCWVISSFFSRLCGKDALTRKIVARENRGIDKHPFFTDRMRLSIDIFLEQGRQKGKCHSLK